MLAWQNFYKTEKGDQYKKESPASVMHFADKSR